MKMNFRESKYNFRIKLDNGYILLYNSLSGSLVEMNEVTERQLKKGKDIYFKLGFLVNDGFDEIKLLKNRMNISNNERKLQLSIAPTLNCNFSCSYCYQNNENSKMSNETLENTKDFLRKLILDEEIKEANLYWMGGEPLLTKSVIKELTNYLKQYVEINAILYTNAYFLDQDFVSQLKNLKINTIYLTIEGREEKHNLKRNIAGKPTYKTIKKNIENAVKVCGERVKIVIRTNIDGDNYSDYRLLLDDFKNLQGKVRFTVSPKISKDNKHIIDNFNDIEEELADMIFERKFGKIKPPSQLGSACPAYSKYSFGIDPQGRVFKCIEGLGTTTPSIGWITGKGLEVMQEELNKWKVDIFSDEVCESCKFLPLCMGGCLAARISSTKTGSESKQERQCVFENLGTLEKRIKRYYENN